MVTLLPSDLTELYDRIIRKICNPSDGLRCARATAIFRWICFAQRPLKLNEILHGLAHTPERLHPAIEDVPVSKILELCQPLIESHQDGTVSFVHFSVQELVPLHRMHH